MGACTEYQVQVCRRGKNNTFKCWFRHDVELQESEVVSTFPNTQGPSPLAYSSLCFCSSASLLFSASQFV